MDNPVNVDELNDDDLKELCATFELKPTKKNRILLKRLVKNVGMDTRALKVALEKAFIGE